MNRVRIFFALIAALAVAAPALAGPEHVDQVMGADHAMMNAPDFELADQNGAMHKLSDYRGKIVVLEWTNPTCPFVQRHYADGHTTMIDLQAKFGGEKVVWLAIDSSNFVNAESATAWASAKHIGYPILLDPSGEVGRMYQAKTTPHMFVIGTEGQVLYDGAIDDNANGKGEMVHNYVEAALTATLAGEPVQIAHTKPYGCSVKYSDADAQTDKTAKKAAAAS